jgi:hypothetical protein
VLGSFDPEIEPGTRPKQRRKERIHDGQISGFFCFSAYLVETKDLICRGFFRNVENKQVKNSHNIGNTPFPVQIA